MWWVTMTLVVTGTPGLSRCRRSRSARCWSSSSSELKRRKSISWVGLHWAVEVRGVPISAKSE